MPRGSDRPGRSGQEAHPEQVVMRMRAHLRVLPPDAKPRDLTLGIAARNARPIRGMAPPYESQRQTQTLRRPAMTQSVQACRRLSFSGPYLSFFPARRKREPEGLSLNWPTWFPLRFPQCNQIEPISEAPLLTASLRRSRPELEWCQELSQTI